MKTLLLGIITSVVALVLGKNDDLNFENLDFGITEDYIMPTVQDDRYWRHIDLH